ncbi:MAG: glycosyltransferase [Thermoguttaceae bacterium]|jgi:glycosyltransferase involved in cell wall biosynthesis|nr:glycosyltransferase [Thermoguttaceae bacterium]
MAMHDTGALTVVLVSTPADWGGGEDQARLLAHGLRARGHRCAVLARRGGALATALATDGLEVHEFPGRGRNPAAWRRIRGALRRIRPDVLHANDAHALWAAGLASLGLGIPARIASRRAAFPLRSAWPYRWLADGVVCVSRAAAEACRQAGVPQQRLRVVHDGVDPARVRSGDRLRGRAGLGLSDADRLLLAVGKLTDCKGHTFLLYAMPAVLARHPEAVCAVVGDGELRHSLEAQALRLGIGHRVRFLGFRRDLPDLIQAADLFVLPSHTEGLCSTLLEAMFAGRPIVATTAGGIPEAIGHGAPADEVCGWSAPPRHAPALAAAILAALDAPEQERARRGACATARAERLFTAERMVEDTVLAYRDFLARVGFRASTHPPMGEGTGL